MTSKGKTPSIVTAATFDDAKMQLHERVEDKVLAAALLRLYFAQLSVKETYYASLAAAGPPIVPITADQWTNWRDDKHAEANVFLIDKVEDVETILVTELVKLPRKTVSDKKIYETAAKNLMQVAHLILTNTPYARSKTVSRLLLLLQLISLTRASTTFFPRPSSMNTRNTLSLPCLKHFPTFITDADLAHAYLSRCSIPCQILTRLLSMSLSNK